MILPSLLVLRGLVTLISYFNLSPRLNSTQMLWKSMARECLSNKKGIKRTPYLLWQKQSKCLDSFPFSWLFSFLGYLGFHFNYSLSSFKISFSFSLFSFWFLIWRKGEFWVGLFFPFNCYIMENMSISWNIYIQSWKRYNVRERHMRFGVFFN